MNREKFVSGIIGIKGKERKGRMKRDREIKLVKPLCRDGTALSGTCKVAKCIRPLGNQSGPSDYLLSCRLTF